MRSTLALVAAAVAALVLASCGGGDGERRAAPAAATATTAAPASAPAESSSAPAAAPPPRVVMVRRAGGVPAGWGERLRRMAGVSAVTRATRAQAMLRATGARPVRAGFLVPLDTLVVRPRAYAAMLPKGERG